MKLSNSSLLSNPNDSGVLLLHDDFTDTNGVFLPAHTIGPVNLHKISWVKSNTYNIEIQSGKATYLEGTAAPVTKDNDHYLEMSTNNLTVECAMHIVDTGTVAHSLVIRYIDILNSVAVQVSTIGSAVWAIEVREQVDTAASTAIAAFILNDLVGVSRIHEENTLKVVDNGSSLLITFLGLEFIVDVTTHNTATKIAFRTDNENLQTWDDLKVWNT